MPSRNHNKVHGKHRGRSNFRPFTVTLYINTLSRVLGDEDIPTPCIEVDTDENVNLVYELKEAPKTSRITILAAVFPSMTNKGGNKLKIYYDDIF